MKTDDYNTTCIYIYVIIVLTISFADEKLQMITILLVLTTSFTNLKRFIYQGIRKVRDVTFHEDRIKIESLLRGSRQDAVKELKKSLTLEKYEDDSDIAWQHEMVIKSRDDLTVLSNKQTLFLNCKFYPLNVDQSKSNL